MSPSSVASEVNSSKIQSHNTFVSKNWVRTKVSLIYWFRTAFGNTTGLNNLSLFRARLQRSSKIGIRTAVWSRKFLIATWSPYHRSLGTKRPQRKHYWWRIFLTASSNVVRARYTFLSRLNCEQEPIMTDDEENDITVNESNRDGMVSSASIDEFQIAGLPNKSAVNRAAGVQFLSRILKSWKHHIDGGMTKAILFATIFLIIMRSFVIIFHYTPTTALLGNAYKCTPISNEQHQIDAGQKELSKDQCARYEMTWSIYEQLQLQFRWHHGVEGDYHIT